MNPDAVVRNMPPAVEPGSVRLAIVGESGALEEASWCYCSSGHGFALEHWSNRQIVQRDRCPHCGSTRFDPRPEPFRGESGRLLDTLLKDAGLPRDRCFVGNVSQRPLAEHEKDLSHCRGGLMRLALDLEHYRPHCVLLLGNLAMSAFLGIGKSVSNWRGSVTQGRLEGKAYKVCVAVHPASILREPSQTALLRLDVKRAVEEAATAMLTLPERKYWRPTDAGLVLQDVRPPQTEPDIPF